MRHVVVMVATSYPRFPGDGVGSFMEPIAKGVAARGHEIHLVAPWHPAITRGKVEDGVHFHFFHYAPVPSLNVFGYAAGLRADTDAPRRPPGPSRRWRSRPAGSKRGASPTKRRATVMHGHWVVPGGVMAARRARPAARRQPARIGRVRRRAARPPRGAPRPRVSRAPRGSPRAATICARAPIALGADPARIETVPYGVDSDPLRAERRRSRGRCGGRSALGDAPVVFSAGRLVRKKGFEYLIDAAGRSAASTPTLRLVIAGDGDLRDELTRARAAVGDGHVVRFLGNQSQDEVARLLAAADVIAVPSVRDDAGNVDGLPNFALEALASATPVVATHAGGLPQVIDRRRDGTLVPERDAGGAGARDRELLASDRARARRTARRVRAIRLGARRRAVRGVYDTGASRLEAVVFGARWYDIRLSRSEVPTVACAVLALHHMTAPRAAPSASASSFPRTTTAERSPASSSRRARPRRS